VDRVYYPGLAGHAGHDLHARQARGSGAVISFATGAFDVSKRIAEAARIFRLSVSFGSVNSSISLPGCMSHASIPAEVRKGRAFDADLVRLSIGIEDSDDLIADLDQAFQRGSETEAALAAGMVGGAQ
jgi:cystathionine beta-lyase